jgi:hypothetical protein
MPGAALNDPELRGYIEGRMRRQRLVIWLAWLPPVIALVVGVTSGMSSAVYIALGIFVFFFSPWVSLAAFLRRVQLRVRRHVLSVYPWQTLPCVQGKKVVSTNNVHYSSVMDYSRVLLLNPVTGSPLGDLKVQASALDMKNAFGTGMTSVRFAGEPTVAGVFAPESVNNRHYARSTFVGARFDRKWTNNRGWSQLRPGVPVDTLMRPIKDYDLQQDAKYPWSDRESEYDELMAARDNRRERRNG